MKNAEIQDIKDQIAEAREYGENDRIPLLREKVNELRLRALEHWMPPERSSSVTTTAEESSSSSADTPLLQ